MRGNWSTNVRFSNVGRPTEEGPAPGFSRARASGLPCHILALKVASVTMAMSMSACADVPELLYQAGTGKTISAMHLVGGRIYFAEAGSEFAATRAQIKSFVPGLSISAPYWTDVVQGREVSALHAAQPYIYFAVGSSVYRLGTGLGGMAEIIATQSSVNSLTKVGDFLFAGGDSLRRHWLLASSTAVVSSVPTALGPGADDLGRYFWCEGGVGGGSIRFLNAGSLSHNIAITGRNAPAHVVPHPLGMYWTERDNLVFFKDFISSGATQISPGSADATRSVSGVAMGANGSALWISRSLVGLGSQIARYRGPGDVTVIHTDPRNLRGPLADSQFVYFETAGGIYRLRQDAIATLPDLSWADLEITQGVQKIDPAGRPFAPLIAERATLVRGYPRCSGVPAYSVTAHLRCLVNGVEVSGSPLAPMPAFKPSLPVGETSIRRADMSASFNWSLPTSWCVPGARLIATINPAGSIAETNVVNNTWDTAAPGRQPADFRRRAHVCVLFKEVWSWGGLSLYDYQESVLASRPRTLSMLPTPDVDFFILPGRLEEYEFPFSAGPFESDDHGAVLTHLYLDNFFADDPDWCDDTNARTHKCGLRGPGSTSGALIGQAFTDADILWVRWGAGTAREPFNAPFDAMTLIHELFHNYGRDHVRCRGDEADWDPAYPYPSGAFAGGEEREHWGFDFVSRTPLTNHNRPPEKTIADIMSYCRPQWVSDYTYRAVFDEISPPPFGPPPDVDRLLVAGHVNPEFTSVRVLRSMSVPGGLVSPSRIEEHLAAQDASLNAPGAVVFVLEVEDASGGVLSSALFGVLSASDGPESDRHFVALADRPAGAAGFRIRPAAQGSPVLFQRRASLNPPAVLTVQSPAPGSLVSGPLACAWVAQDADGDPMTHLVQYSRDGGQRWETLAVGTGASSWSLDDTSWLPGSAFQNGSMIRVISDDGFHTSVREGPGFNVPGKPAFLHMERLRPNQAGPQPEPPTLVGRGFDPEVGPLPSSRLAWRITGDNLDITYPGGDRSDIQTLLAVGTYSIELFDQLDTSNRIAVTYTCTEAAVPPDFDADGVPDDSDKCPTVADPAQLDRDSDGVGDLCDNCPANPGTQQDTDHDGLGDPCDPNPTIPTRPFLDGRDTGEYPGDFSAVQNTALPAASDDNTLSDGFHANGSELDGARTRIEAGVLYIILTGNLRSDGTSLEVFFDSVPGGQNRLRGDNANVDGNGLNRLGDSGSGSGLRFDAAFVPDYYMTISGSGEPYALNVWMADLPATGGGAGRLLGVGTGGPGGLLYGGSNPSGVQVAIDNSNTGGVSATLADGRGVASGIEIAIPLADLGDPGCGVKICAFITGPGHAPMKTQILAGVRGLAVPSEPRSVNLGSIGGAQYFEVGALRSVSISAPVPQPEANFGRGLALDASDLVVGQRRLDRPGATDAGAAYAFERIDDAWGPPIELQPTPFAAAGDRFGSAIAVSGGWAWIGAPNRDQTGVGGDVGAVYVFQKSGPASWVQTQVILPPDPQAGSTFGAAVDVDGSRAIVGAPLRDATGADSGKAYVYELSGSLWILARHLSPPDAAAGDQFGTDVAISARRAVIGAPGKDRPGQSDAGGAYLWTRSVSAWPGLPERTWDSPAAAAGQRFGASVDIAADVAVVGAPSSGSGAAYAFYRTNSWPTAATHALTAPDLSSGDLFGFAVATDGVIAAVGTPNHGRPFFDVGAVYAFSLSESQASLGGKFSSPGGAPGDALGGEVSVQGSTLAVGAGAVDPGGAAYVFNLAGNGPLITAWPAGGEYPTGQSLVLSWSVSTVTGGSWRVTRGAVEVASGDLAPGAESPTLAITVGPATLGVYRLLITTPCELLESPATVIAEGCAGPPTIDSQQGGGATCWHGTAYFSVTASGEGQTNYQWRFEGTPLTDGVSSSGALFAGALTRELVGANLSSLDEGLFDCVVTGPCGSAVSQPIPLSVCVGDFNCDGAPDGADVGDFFERWEAGDLAADVNSDYGIDGPDVEYFFLRWESGC